MADAAVIVVAGPAGVEVGTHEMWRMAQERGLPRIIFISKMDRENVEYQQVLDSLAESFGRQCVATQVPIGSEADFSGVVSLLDPDEDVPPEMREQVEAAKQLKYI